MLNRFPIVLVGGVMLMAAGCLFESTDYTSTETWDIWESGSQKIGEDRPQNSDSPTFDIDDSIIPDPILPFDPTDPKNNGPGPISNNNHAANNTPGDTDKEFPDYDGINLGEDIENCVPDVFVSCANQDLRGAQWPELDISKGDLARANLGGANLKGTDLSYAKLAGASLRFADLTGAILWGADLEGADLTGAILDRAELSYAKLSFANLTDASLQNAVMQGADVQHADLSNALLQGSQFKYADFSDAILDFANLSDCDGFSARFKRASLIETNFGGCDVQFADFVASTFIQTRMDSTLSQSADYRNALLTAVFFVDTNLHHAANMEATVRSDIVWKRAICPNGTNSDANNDSCEGHWE